MKVGVLEVERDGCHCLRCAAGDFREVELDPMWEVDADTMLSPRRGAADRMGRGLEHSWHYDPRCSTLNIHVELDAPDERGVDRARHRAIDPPVGSPLIGLLTVHDGS